MILVDTNILAYLLIEGDYTEAARELHQRDPDWRSESLIMIEFCNVLLRSMEVRGMKLAAARGFLANAETILDGKLTRIPHQQSLTTGARFAVTAYDARFLTLADELHILLVTEDARLRRAAPGLTQSLADALGKT